MMISFISLRMEGQKITSHLNWPGVMVVLLVLYVSVCAFLRFRRLSKIRSRHKFPDRASCSRMTGADAQAIIENAYTYEFPLFFGLSLTYALFKTFAIEDIARLLNSSSDLGKTRNTSKRFEDTGIIFACFMLFPPHSPQFQHAVARMNYLHAPYIKSGKIQTQDLLYVLYTSMVEPVRFIKLYEWRHLTEMEIAAQGTLWKHIGDIMGIDYTEQLGRSDWKDGIEFMEDVEQWARGYERDRLQPSPSSKRLAQVQLDMVLSIFPTVMRPLMHQMGLAIMGERMRYAFSLPEPGLGVSALTFTLMWLRWVSIRFLLPPRLLAQRYVSSPDPKTGRMYSTHYIKEPWYNQPTISARWGPMSWITRAVGGMLPGDGGAEMKPDGFLFEDIGPPNKMGTGIEEGIHMATAVRKAAAVNGGCPFAV